MQMDRPPEPPDGTEPSHDGRPPVGRPTAPVRSVRQFRSPDAAEASVMADQRSADPITTTEEPAAPRGTARVRADSSPATPPSPVTPPDAARGSASVPGGRSAVRPDPARGSAPVGPAAPAGPDAGRPAVTDIQTSAGVPARPIRDAAAPATDDAAPQQPAAPQNNAAETTVIELPATPAAKAAETTVIELPATPATKPDPAAQDPAQTTIIEPVGNTTTGGGEESAVIWRPTAPAKDTAASSGEETKVIRRPAKDDTASSGEDTKVIRRSQVKKAITLPGGPPTTPAKPHAAATVAGPPAGPAPTAVSPADRTQVLRPNETRTQRIVVLPGRGERTVTIPAAPRVEQPQPEVDRRRAPRGGPSDLGHAPAVLLLSSLGVLLVALAYTGGREGASWGTTAYWIGQVVVFTPVVLRLLSRRMAGVGESFLLVMGLAVNQYLLKWMYSPDQFRFPDELQHWLATTVIMETGELFRPNPALPPAVHFPGLAEMGAALASMTGLPVTASGIIVAGVAHLVFVGVLFVCVLRTSNSPAVAGVACATYATALHYLFFSSMFLYQTAALPFFMLAIWATRRWREEGGRPFVVVAVASIAITTVSHHVTAFALIATLLLLGVTELVVDRPRRFSALAMPGVAFGVVTAWILLVARDVIGYLEEPVNQVITTVSSLATGATDPSSASAPVSVAQLALQGTGLLGLFVLYVAVGRDMVTRRDADWWRWSALVGGGIFFAGNGVRFLGQNGPEIAGRLSTFTYIPISIIAAISLVRAVQILPSRDADGRRWWVAPALEVPPPTGRNLVVRVLAGSALVTLLMIGARAGGWPPLGSLLPGPYLAGGFERSVDAYGVDAARWQRDALGPDNRVGGDVTSVSLSSTYGRQDPVREVGPLYYADQWTLADDELVETLHVDYLVVDRRLGTQLPQNDAYFENDPRAGRITQPLTATQLAKFDGLADVDRLYDNGTVRIYRMGGAR